MKLKKIDLSCSAFSDIACDKIDDAVRTGHVESLAKIIHETYGNLLEVIFIKGPHQGQSILVFESGLGIIVGANTPMGILTHGYIGQGPTSYTRLLDYFGFLYSDATSISTPSILSKDGRLISGHADTTKIVWDDGHVLPLDFLDQYEQLFNS